MGQFDRRSGHLLDLTAEIVSAYVRSQHLPRDKVSTIVRDVHEALAGLAAQNNASHQQALALQPAVSPSKSVQDDYIVCLEDGKRFKSMKQHLMKGFGLTPDQYRAKWGLAPDYPMVAPSYAAARSRVSKTYWRVRKDRSTSV